MVLFLHFFQLFLLVGLEIIFSHDPKTLWQIHFLSFLVDIFQLFDLEVSQIIEQFRLADFSETIFNNSKQIDEDILDQSSNIFVSMVHQSKQLSKQRPCFLTIQLAQKLIVPKYPDQYLQTSASVFRVLTTELFYNVA